MTTETTRGLDLRRRARSVGIRYRKHRAIHHRGARVPMHIVSDPYADQAPGDINFITLSVSRVVRSVLWLSLLLPLLAHKRCRRHGRSHRAQAQEQRREHRQKPEHVLGYDCEQPARHPLRPRPVANRKCGSRATGRSRRVHTAVSDTFRSQGLVATPVSIAMCPIGLLPTAPWKVDQRPGVDEPTAVYSGKTTPRRRRGHSEPSSSPWPGRGISRVYSIYM